MKARQSKSTEARENRLNTCTAQIQRIYKEKFKENALNSFMLGAHSVWMLIGEQYIEPLNNADSKEKREEIVASLIQRCETEAFNAKNNYEKAKREEARRIEKAARRKDTSK